MKYVRKQKRADRLIKRLLKVTEDRGIVMICLDWSSEHPLKLYGPDGEQMLHGSGAIPGDTVWCSRI